MKDLALIIPVYNGEQTIKPLLDSLLPQLTHDVECVFIDDGSRDGSHELLISTTSEYDNVKVLSQSNQGVAATRNRGLSETMSRYVWFIDGDDWLEPNALAIVLANIKQTQAAMIHFNYVDHFLNGNTSENPYFLHGKESYKGEEFYRMAINKFSYELKNMVWSFVFARDFLVQHDLTFNSQLPIFEDVVFLAQCYQTSAEITILNQALYHYQQHPSSLTHTANHFNEANYQAVVDVLLGLKWQDEKIVSALKYYLLVFVSRGANGFDSKFIKQLLKLNGKNQRVYKFIWNLKLFSNRLMRKLFRVPMFWK